MFVAVVEYACCCAIGRLATTGGVLFIVAGATGYGAGRCIRCATGLACINCGYFSVAVHMCSCLRHLCRSTAMKACGWIHAVLLSTNLAATIGKRVCFCVDTQ